MVMFQFKVHVYDVQISFFEILKFPDKMQITYGTRAQNTPTYFRVIKSDTNCNPEIDGKMTQ